MSTTVAVIGGGVGGLSAAQELAERGFEVTVYEARDRFGGKARSIPVPDSGTEETEPLPGEHGFRFFPGFYQHVTDTMKRIPDGDGTVHDNLVATDRLLMASADAPGVSLPTDLPDSVGEWRHALSELIGGDDVPAAERRFFVGRLLEFLTSCEDRRFDEFEQTSWWEFVDAESMSPAYRAQLGRGLTQSLVAMRPEAASTRTIGRIYVQMLRGLLDPGLDADSVLNAPSNEAWIDPWTAYLADMGVTLRPETPATGLHTDGRRLTGVTVANGGREREVTADYYVLAVPVEVATDLAGSHLREAAPSLGGLDRLDTAWMNGIQFYLSESVPAVRGHGLHLDSPWALTSVSQGQFWARGLRGRGDGRVADVLSVCISDWTEPGVLYDRPARECSREEIKEEVWAQLRAHLDSEGAVLGEEILVDWFLDPAISHPEPRRAENAEPLLVNTTGSWQHRPEAETALENLVLAADYVRTETDLASMEGANEAARRAVNAIVRDADRRAPECELWELREPGIFRPLKAQDRLRHRLGLPHPGTVGRRIRRANRSLRATLG